MNWKTIILIIILGIAVAYATLQYIEYRDMKALEKLKESKPAEIQEELKKQRTEAGTKPFSEEKAIRQTEELKALRKESGIQPLSEEQIQKQIEELNKLKELYK